MFDSGPLATRPSSHAVRTYVTSMKSTVPTGDPLTSTLAWLSICTLGAGPAATDASTSSISTLEVIV
jgi:hypothetical protein